MITFHGLNIVKLIALVSIFVLHANEFIFYSDVHPTNSKIYSLLALFARCHVISGQVLIFLIYFLFGFKNKTNLSLIKISLFALLGQVVLTLIFMSEGQKIEWDIYLFIAVSNLILIILTPVRNHWMMIVFSFILLWIPSLLYAFPQPEIWPLLPWFFLTSLAFATGCLFRKYVILFANGATWEWVLWPGLILISLPFFGAYFHTPIGANFYRFALYQKPWIFWANFWPYLFFIRISYLSTVQNTLQRLPLMRFVSRLHWCRHMGQLYLISVIMLGFAATQSDFFLNNPSYFDLFLLSVMPACEFISRGLRRFFWKKLPD